MFIKPIIILVFALVSVVVQALPEDEKRELECGESAKLGLVDKLFNRPIKPEQFPYLVKISVLRNNTSVPVLCSGTLISRDSLLSSLKCFRKNYKDLNDTIKVQFGGSNKEFKVKNIYVSGNPSLKTTCRNETIDNGLAIVQLEEPVTYSLSKEVIANRACLDLKNTVNKLPDISIILPTKDYTIKPESGNNKVKYAVPLKTFRCQNEPSSYRVCGKNKRSPNLPLILPEGAPILRMSKRQRWTLVGININENPLWGNCTEDSNKNYARFLTFDGESEQKFLNSYTSQSFDLELY